MVDDSEEFDMAVLVAEPGRLTGQRLGTKRRVTLRPAGEPWNLPVPGEIATVAIQRRRSTVLFGNIVAVRLDAAGLGLKPLDLDDFGMWSPAEEYWGEDGDRVDPCLLPVLSAGPRPAFEMHQILPGADFTVLDGFDPILHAIELSERGQTAKARRVLHTCLLTDLRCLDAHAHLGNLEFDGNTPRALRHYQAGSAIGELSVPKDNPWVLPWGGVDNRPFLRCLNGQGTALWRLGRFREALDVMERLLWLLPSDELGTRFIVEDVRRGVPWHP